MLHCKKTTLFTVILSLFFVVLIGCSDSQHDLELSEEAEFQNAELVEKKNIKQTYTYIFTIEPNLDEQIITSIKKMSKDITKKIGEEHYLPHTVIAIYFFLIRAISKPSNTV